MLSSSSTENWERGLSSCSLSDMVVGQVSDEGLGVINDLRGVERRSRLTDQGRSSSCCTTSSPSFMHAYMHSALSDAMDGERCR